MSKHSLIKLVYKKPIGCYSCVHFKWIDNPVVEPGSEKLVPNCRRGYDGIMKAFFKINQYKKRSKIESSPNCMVTHLDLCDDDASPVIDEESAFEEEE